MIKVKAIYVNKPFKSGKDYFIYTDVEVSGHASNTDYSTNNKVCAGVSACCSGIYRLMNDEQFKVEYGKGYFHCYTNVRVNMKSRLDKDSIYALNTLICQLFEIYNRYPTAFKSFELVDEKEIIEDGKQPNKQKRKPFRKRRNHLGIHSLIESPHFEEN